MATFLQPTVLEDVDLESFKQQLLDTHGPSSTLVVCSSKESFLQQLQATIANSTRNQHPEETPTAQPPDEDDPAKPKGASPPECNARQHRWTIPTLRLLASAQTLKLAFCEDVTHLRAYLAAYAYQHPPSDIPTTQALSTQSPRILALLNPITLHRPTSNFSAQGLNRTFSIAVDAAYASGSKLIVAECGTPAAAQSSERQAETHDRGEVIAMEAGNGSSIWDEEVSILNVATKTFGAGERGWVGRTVKLRAIGGRWFVFEKWSKAGS